MTRLVRALRGAAVIGSAWGFAWILVGALIAAVIGVVSPEDIGPGEGPERALPILGLVGLLSGVGFAALLAFAERRTQLEELSLPRVALWGLLGSAAIPLLMGADASMGWVTGPMGAVFATASVAIARRASTVNVA
jgi:membrane associated rhomboid family serine protease